MPYGIIGALILALDIYVIYLILTSSADSTTKLLWVILVLVLAILLPRSTASAVRANDSIHAPRPT